jgi:hypothetical protein
MGLIKDIFDIWISGQWGTFRMPDGTGVFYPWVVPRLVYLVPSDEMYMRIRRSIILWGLLFFFGGAFLGPVAINILVLPSTEPTWYIFCLEAAVCLLPMILMYIRWARKVTQNLPLFDEQAVSQALDPTSAPTYEESVKRNLAPHSLFYFYACLLFGLTFTSACVFLLIQEPQDWPLWLGALFFGVCTIAVVFAIRIKRKMPKHDFF